MVSEINENEPYDIISQIISINFVNFNMDFYDEGKAHRCFKLIDTDKDGKLSKNELNYFKSIESSILLSRLYLTYCFNKSSVVI